MATPNIDTTQLTELIAAFRALQARHSVTPDGLGAVLQSMATLLGQAAQASTAADALSKATAALTATDAAMDRATDATDALTLLTAAVTDAATRLATGQSWLALAWDEACRQSKERFGQIPGRFNPDTGLFELNGITDISLPEAAGILAFWPQTRVMPDDCTRRFYRYPYRTAFPIAPSRWGGRGARCTALFHNSVTLEVVCAWWVIPYGSCDVIEWDSAFDGCTKLRKVFGLDFHGYSSNANLNNMFRNCAALEEANMRGLNANLDLRWSPQFSVESLRYIIANRYWGKYVLNGSPANYPINPITLTLHQDVFAALPDDLLPLATERNITLTCPVTLQ